MNRETKGVYMELIQDLPEVFEKFAEQRKVCDTGKEYPLYQCGDRLFPVGCGTVEYKSCCVY